MTINSIIDWLKSLGFNGDGTVPSGSSSPSSRSPSPTQQQRASLIATTVQPKLNTSSPKRPTAPEYAKAVGRTIEARFENVDKNDFCESDTQEICHDIFFLNQLQQLKDKLDSPTASREDILTVFNRLDKDVLGLLCQYVWIAHYMPSGDNDFGRHAVEKNPKILLDIQNGEKINLIEQMILHQSGQIKLKREIVALENFNSSAEKVRAFQSLSLSLRQDLGYKVWQQDGGASNPSFKSLKYNYGEDAIIANPDILTTTTYTHTQQSLLDLALKERQRKIKGIKNCVIDSRTEKEAVRTHTHDTSLDKLNKPELRLLDKVPEDFRMAIVAPEFGKYINAGGLANAVFAMAKSINGLTDEMTSAGKTGKKVRVILPYSDVLPDDIKKKIDSPDGLPPGEGLKIKYQLKIDGKDAYVFKLKMDGMRYYFIKYNNAFNVGCDSQGAPNKIYEGSHDEATRRWSIFQSLAADLIWEMQKQKMEKELTDGKKHCLDVVHVHDSQIALVPEILATRHPKEWREGKTPAAVFTFHNNLQQEHYYDNPHDEKYLKMLNLPEHYTNSFVSALTSVKGPDFCTTVSKQFASEAQGRLFGNGAEHAVQHIADQGRLIGITNGNTSGFDPKTNQQLKDWIDQETKRPVDLTFDPTADDLILKKIECKKQLAKYLDVHRGKETDRDNDINLFGNIDPEKPIFLYVGRLDYLQKGIDKLPLIMETCLKEGAQFICMGIDPQEEAKNVLREMKKTACTKHKGEGIVIFCDHRRKEDKRLYWQQGNTPECSGGAPGFGEVIRVAADVGVAPSIFEPCGLIQGEHYQHGIPVVATAVGGFKDTVITDGDDKTGYLFERCDDWYSDTQKAHIIKTMELAIMEAKENLQQMTSSNEFYIAYQKERIRKLMRHGFENSWTTTKDGSMPPATQLFTVFGRAIQRATHERGIIPLNAHLVTQLPIT